MTGAGDWIGRVGDVWAAEWRATDRSLAALGRHLDAAILDAAPAAPCRALDVGCGAGATSLALARARPDVLVTGVDLSSGLAEVAARRVADLSNVRVRCGDVLELAGAIRPDLIVSRHGVMFFADPVAAFVTLRRAATPGAGLVFSCFGARSDNRFATLADELTGGGGLPDDDAPGPFAFADPDRVAAILTGAGWTIDAAVPTAFAYRVGEGPDPVADAIAFLSRIGPLARRMVAASPDDRVTLRTALAGRLTHYLDDGAIDLPASAWIWRARA